MRTRILATVAALAIVSGGLSFAQTATFQIDFPFMAGNETLPAGQYSIDIVRPDSVRISGAGGRAIMLSLTRLGRHDKDVETELVFDKVEGKYLLSEVWYPEKDGYLVLATSQVHEHAVLGGSNPRK